MRHFEMRIKFLAHLEQKRLHRIWLNSDLIFRYENLDLTTKTRIESGNNVL